MRYNKKNSIRRKAITVLMAGIILSCLVVGGINLYYMNSTETESANTLLNKECMIEVGKIDAVLDPMAAAVETLEMYIDEHLEHASDLEDEDFVRAITDDLEKLSRNIVNNTELCETVYVRFNPELTWPTSGLFLTRGFYGSFTTQTPTDLSAFDRDDTEHVGWYYIPLDKGEAMWMDPYLNQNIDVYMISYVVPLVKDGAEVGVVGMDINFDTVCEMVAGISSYETGRAFLADAEGNIVYGPDLEDEAAIWDYCIDRGGVDREFLHEDNSGNSTHLFRYNGGKVKLAFATLENGMKLCLSASEDEIYKDVKKMVLGSSAAALFFILLFLLLGVAGLSRIFKPLIELSKATTHATDRDYEIDIDYDKDDEIGILADNFRTLMSRTRSYVHDIKDAAYRDLFTGTASKLAYMEKVMQIDRHEDGGFAAYAVVVMDVNNLKATNDAYGHNMGDLLIYKTAAVIRETFSDCTVYRTGGDEFVVILEGERFEKRDEYILNFGLNLEKANASENALPVKLAIAMGMAEHEAGSGEQFAEVFDRADRAMYANKAELKADQAAETAEYTAEAGTEPGSEG